ncbi:hypothetical protein BCR32DRAFT_325295 [Anaeromyces robustus]|uniref:Uncharacterized protein n=1 Tax=Anaeromyces robustus TaxID=1754192 RepID=A0A1Y1XIW1_9FUNG|nr:hypothetical protein BCR32DRAFT_325295 [Anaeromyces robustus]|eukprot:ORX85698.1 hypothetical protein BCR32DRAFT_325295 [Anaeromyces robustus]
MKSLAKRISQTFVKDSSETIDINENENGTNNPLNIKKELKKKKSIKDMMVDTFKNPFSYLKNGSNNTVLPNNQNITDVTYSTFSSTEFESVFNHPVKSNPSKLLYVPKSLQHSFVKNEVDVNDTSTVNSNDFSNINVHVASSSTVSNEIDEKIINQNEEEKEDEEKEIEEEKMSSESTLCSDDQIDRSDSGYSDKSKNSKKESKYTFFPWRFIKRQISFTKSEVVSFCNNNKLTSYDRYENYNSDNETADISEDETAIELQVINSNENEISEKDLIPEPENNENHQFSI